MTDTDSNPPRERIVVGCMTGTSLDGLDAALVRIVGTGLDMTAEYLGWVSHPMDPGLRDTLMHLASGGAAEPLTYLRAARGMGELYADGVQHLLDETDGPRPAFVVAHGQTIWHAPRDPRQDDAGSTIPGGGPKSWQLFDPWPVVRRHGVPVCYDLRQADLIAGGEGAPLTPLADWVMYRGRADLIANLGGVFNCTYWSLGTEPGVGAVEGGDICLCNLLLDGLAQRLIDRPYDKDGAVASSGMFDESLWRDLSGRLEVVSPGGGSLGRENLQSGVIDRIVTDHQDRTAADILFNAIAFVGQTIGEVFEGTAAQRLVLAGGGAKNKTLVKYIRDVIEPDSFCESVFLSDDLGIPCEAREAMGFAVLGALSQDGVPCSLPQVTGAKDPGVAGVWAGPSPR